MIMKGIKMFSVRLKEIRKSMNLTQKEVATAINFAERNYQELEYGNCKPSFDTLIALADFFNVSLDYLVGRSNIPTLLRGKENLLMEDYAERIIKKNEIFIQETLQWIRSMLFRNEIRIADVPQHIRLSLPQLYVTAFRISRDISVQRYVSDMQTLQADILACNNDSEEYTRLKERMTDCLNWLEQESENDYIDFLSKNPPLEQSG